MNIIIVITIITVKKLLNAIPKKGRELGFKAAIENEGGFSCRLY
jgi:hypothetical protein